MILLDTHVVLWLAFEPEKVSRLAHEKIVKERSGNSGLAVSAMTLLELAILASKGRFNLIIPINSFLDQIEDTFVVLPITGRACARTLELPAGYPGDPADRIIGATAIAEGLTLITADQNIIRSKAVQTLW